MRFQVFIFEWSKVDYLQRPFLKAYYICVHGLKIEFDFYTMDFDVLFTHMIWVIYKVCMATLETYMAS
jgi:hypothetical protein